MFEATLSMEGDAASCALSVSLCMLQIKAETTIHLYYSTWLEPGAEASNFPPACFCDNPNSWESHFVLSQKNDAAVP